VTDPPVVLSIGGSDSAGCYGLQADARALAACGVHAAGAVTVVTAQNTLGVRTALPVPTELIAAQLDAVLDDLTVAAVKTGMLGRAEVIELVGRWAAAGRLPNLVVDPVLVNRHGSVMFGTEVVDAYRRHLLPHARLVAPNRIEAALLAGAAFDDDDAPVAEQLVEHLGGPAVITAGRDPGAEAIDVFWDGAALHHLAAARVPTANNAGSGDTFSAVVAAGLARGEGLLEAVTGAKAFTARALASAAGWRLGAGPGPLDPFGWTHPRPHPGVG
jgi:hydroxymethylpyrimidine/phosphomethylpyrimidine kinase